MKDQIKKVFRKIIKETPSKLSTKALKRANKINKLNAGTPHDWEDYEKYLKEETEYKNKTRNHFKLAYTNILHFPSPYLYKMCMPTSF